MRAFTLIEMLIVLALMMTLASVSVIAGTESYQRALTSGDADRMVSLLYRARAMSLAGVCLLDSCGAESTHGIAVFGHEVSLREDNRVLESYELSPDLIVPPAIVEFTRGGWSEGGVVRMQPRFGKEYLINVSELGAISVE